MTAALPELVGAREVVPAEPVDAMVASVRFDLALLSDHVQRAEAEADALERLIADAPPVRGDELAAFERLSGYFQQLTAELEERRRAAVEAARAEADERLTRARDDAVLIRLDGPGIDPPDAAAVELLTVATLPAADLGDLLETSEAAQAEDAVEAIEPVVPAAPIDAALLEGIDLTELPELLPILEAMIAGQPLPADESPVLVDAPRAAEAQPAAAAAAEVAPVEPPAPPTASGVTPDTGERFDTFWNAPEPVEPPEAARWWSSIPMAALASMLAVVVVVVLLLALIG